MSHSATDTVRSAFRMLAAVAFVSTGATLSACDDDDNGLEPGEPTEAAFTLRIENVGEMHEVLKSGSFDTPVGASAPAALLPGDAYEVDLTAPPGAHFSFATMFIPSNDFFFAPDEDGIPLYDANGDPVDGVVTSQIMLWDAGTEENQEPGLGDDQAPSQGDPDTGASDPDISVRPAADDFGNLPDVEDVIEVMVQHDSAQRFTVIIQNVSDSTTLMTSDGGRQAVPLSPGAWVLHTESAPLFTAGDPLEDDGLEAIAEDGDPATLADNLEERSGVTVPLSPGVWAVYQGDNPVFTVGSADADDGLEAVAEDGDPTALAAALGAATDVDASGTFTMPEGSATAGPIGPGEAYEIQFTAMEGDRLSFATMFVASNDLFYGPEDGIALFNGDVPANGDLTAQVGLWDAGTEVNQEPGVGPDQVQRQDGPDSGEDEDGIIRAIADVEDGYFYPPVGDIIRVTIVSTPIVN
ncbi:MAG: spondin domain-containing protein [Gemmatimonadetes bacterium]|nr:spondin domain-containing protein [Gemmatimonadota bacterium]